MIDGLSNFLDEKGMKSVNELRGAALPAYSEWGELDLNYKVAAHIDPRSASAATCATWPAATPRYTASTPMSIPCPRASRTDT